MIGSLYSRKCIFIYTNGWDDGVDYALDQINFARFGIVSS
jgi:hypothetical protein